MGRILFAGETQLDRAVYRLLWSNHLYVTAKSYRRKIKESRSSNAVEICKITTFPLYKCPHCDCEIYSTFGNIIEIFASKVMDCCKNAGMPIVIIECKVEKIKDKNNKTDERYVLKVVLKEELSGKKTNNSRTNS